MRSQEKFSPCDFGSSCRFNMDPIEPAGDPERSQGQPTEPTESPPTRPGPSTLRTRSSSRTRRPSIRLSRFPSIPQINTENLPADQTPAIERQAIQSPPPREEDEVSPHGRRRSSSEPRPGRWSSPPPDVLSRVATPGRMMPVTEESSRPSLSVTSPPPVHLAQEDGGDYFQSAETEQPEAPAAVARPPGRLRRASQSAMNRFSRNRASTVTGVPPTLSQQNEEPTNEYGSHVVDVLDVIGRSCSCAKKPIHRTNMIRPRGLGAIHSYQCAELFVHSEFGWLHQSYAHIYHHPTAILLG